MEFTRLHRNYDAAWRKGNNSDGQRYHVRDTSGRHAIAGSGPWAAESALQWTRQVETLTAATVSHKGESTKAGENLGARGKSGRLECMAGGGQPSRVSLVMGSVTPRPLPATHPALHTTSPTLMTSSAAPGKYHRRRRSLIREQSDVHCQCPTGPQHRAAHGVKQRAPRDIQARLV